MPQASGTKRPDDPIDLARRIGEFRQGCSVLILSPHKPLSGQDRAWLVGKCRAWAAKLDAHLAASRRRSKRGEGTRRCQRHDQQADRGAAGSRAQALG